MAEEHVSAADENRKAAKATGKIGIAVMLSRVLGLLRDIFMVRLFGTSVLADCFNLAFKIPNLLRDLFAEGALSQAFVTTFSKRLKEEGEESAWALANRVLSLAAVVMSAVTILGVLLAPWIVDLILSFADKSFGQEQRDLIVLLARIMYPFLLLVSLAALVMGMLNAKQVFGIPALSSCFFNLGCIIGGGSIGYWMDPQWGEKSLIGISVGVLLGGLGQLVVQFPALWRVGFRPRVDALWSDSGVKKIVSLMGPAMIAASAVQVNVMVNAMFATSTGEGGVSALNYAFRLMQLPIGVFGVAVATVTLPALSRAAVGGIGKEFSPTLMRGINLVTILVLPCAVGLCLLATPLVAVIFKGDDMNHQSTRMIAGALQCYGYGLLCYSWIKIVQPAFYAIDRRWVPMAISFVAMAVNFGLNWYFVRVMQWGHESLALTTSLVAVMNFVLLTVMLRRYVSGLSPWSLLDPLWRCLIAAAVMGEFCWLANRFVLSGIEVMPWLLRAASLTITIGIGAAVYFALCYWLGVREALDCLGLLLRRVPGLKKFAPRAGK
jgi:putative peptidoglycan lipid II flippase